MRASGGLLTFREIPIQSAEYFVISFHAADKLRQNLAGIAQCAAFQLIGQRSGNSIQRIAVHFRTDTDHAVPYNTLICDNHHKGASDGNRHQLDCLQPGFKPVRGKNHCCVLCQAGQHTGRMIYDVLHLVNPSGEMTQNALRAVIRYHARLQQGIHIKPVRLG